MFESLPGYYDALYGIYGTMASGRLYGGQMTCGLVDKLGQVFGIVGNPSVPDASLLSYRYRDEEARKQIDALWWAMYQTIGYTNNALQSLEHPKFEAPELRTVQGELLGLRAFLHLDLLRLFAPSYATAQASAKPLAGIPYAYNYQNKNHQVYSTLECYERVLRDLDQAEQLLSEDEHIARDGDFEPNFVQAHRVVHFNKYAVFATKARVYRLMRRYDEAAKYARLVIQHSSDFHLAARGEFSTVTRFPAPGELIFGLYAPSFLQHVASIFLTAGSSGVVTEGRLPELLDELYSSSSSEGGAIDERYGSYYSKRGYSQFIRFVTTRPELLSSTAATRGLCLIRLPEQYYILAESLWDKDPKAALEALNAVRLSRGLAALPEGQFSSRAELEEELMREYYREYPGEGQIFPSLKHYAQPFLSITGERLIQPSTDIFVLPQPKLEAEKGDHFKQD